MNLLKIIKEYIHNRPIIKKVVGVILILVGFSSLLTPLTPGSWLLIIGLEWVGIRILFLDPLRRSPREASKLKFWKKK
ncbi:MAG: hypothetical protein AAB682_00310 [Patescibacteria group bacterium]